MRMM